MEKEAMEVCSDDTASITLPTNSSTTITITPVTVASTTATVTSATIMAIPSTTIAAATTSTTTSATITVCTAVTNNIEENHEPKKEVVYHTPQIVRVPVKHTNLGIRSPAMDMSTMVELTAFSTLGKIQPFLINISATAALVVDLHCHLIDKEVCGYLGGHWDINTHTLSILGAFPCRYAGKEKSAAAAVEAEISKAMEWKRMTLVGWYHSHPRTHASPSLRDVDAQLDYEIKMKGPSDNGYTPCVALICSPYNPDTNCYESNFNLFWSMPPPENRPHEYPRPMLLSYTLTQEQYISQDALEEIKKCIEYYKIDGGIDFTSKFNAKTTYLQRLKNSLTSKLPRQNNRVNGTYWEVIKEMVAPGFDDGSESFANMKFPLIPDPSIQPPGLPSGTNLFLAPVNSISAVQKAYAMHQAENAETNNHKESNSSKLASHIMNTPEGLSTFRAGELTVSVKTTKNADYDYTPTDFTKIESMKGRNEYPPIHDLPHHLKIPDLAKLASLSPAELAKITGFSLSDFTKAAQSSAYMRNLTNFFGPLSKTMSEMSESNDRRSGDFADLSMPFKPPNASSPAPKELASERKKSIIEPMDTSGSYTEDLSMSSSKRDYGGMLDMTTTATKKYHHSIDSGESLNLTKDRQ